MNDNLYGFGSTGEARAAHVLPEDTTAAQPPRLIAAYFPAEQTPAARVDAAPERLKLHLSYGPYAGWKDTIRQDVETVLEAWREYQREQGAV